MQLTNCSCIYFDESCSDHNYTQRYIIPPTMSSNVLQLMRALLMEAGRLGIQWWVLALKAADMAPKLCSRGNVTIHRLWMMVLSAWVLPHSQSPVSTSTAQVVKVTSTYMFFYSRVLKCWYFVHYHYCSCFANWINSYQVSLNVWLHFYGYLMPRHLSFIKFLSLKET